MFDEVLDKFDKEFEVENLDEMELGVNRIGDVLNGIGEDEIYEVVSFLYWIMCEIRCMFCNLIYYYVM